MAATIIFCSGGTSSGFSSTPRSPRATMIASASSMISSSRSIAAGFSILAISAPYPPIRRRASATSSGRCTNDSAIQSAPCCTAKARSRRSFSVSAGTGTTASGTFTPLRSEMTPPTSAEHRIASSLARITFRRSLPSSISRRCPFSSTPNNSGCGRQTRVSSPGAGLRSSVKWLPWRITALPPANWPTRSFGPCKSHRMPTGRPIAFSTARIAAIVSAWVS